MSLKKINKKIISKQAKVQYSVQNTFMNTESPLFCDKCKKRLGLISMVHFALGKKKGEPYIVICKHCGFKNHRLKGALSDKIDKDWGDNGF